MNPTHDFSGQVALVTAAASGFGLATAQQLGFAGAAVVIAEVNEASVFETGQTFVDAGHEAQAEVMIQRTVQAFGRLDAAFNNAGVSTPSVDTANELAKNYDRVNAGLTVSAAAEYAARGISINAVCPSTIDTQTVDQLIEKGVLVLANSLSHAPIGRVGRPEEIASVLLRSKSPRRRRPSFRRWLCGSVDDQTLLEDES